MKKSAQRRRKHCALAVVRRSQKLRPAADLLPGARDGQYLISWRWSLPLPTNPVWWGSMHASSSYRGNRPTHTHKHTHPQTGPITIHCVAAIAQCNNTANGNNPTVEIIRLTLVLFRCYWLQVKMIYITSLSTQSRQLWQCSNVIVWS